MKYIKCGDLTPYCCSPILYALCQIGGGAGNRTPVLSLALPKGALPLWRSPQATCYPKSVGKIFSHTLFKDLIAFTSLYPFTFILFPWIWWRRGESNPGPYIKK